VNGPYRFGRFELNPATRQLFADGGQVTLGARAFDVLVALVERRERMVSKDELLAIGWPGLVVEENNLDVQISALRKALGPAAITTVRGRGYRFAPKLDSDPAPAPERPPEAPERRKEPRPWLIPPQSEGPRLAAVLFTDVVGYSARMQKDEAGTIGLVKADFEYMRALCGKHGGESLNTMGDGLLLCFPSALQAVQCALHIQRAFGTRKPSDPQALEHRIGVHLGDVFHLDTGDVAGDGINIASRLEAKAPPGGICMSQTIYDTVKGKLPLRARFLGPEVFKNIAEPVLSWEVLPEGAPESAKTVSKPEPLPAPQPRFPVRRMTWISGGAATVVAMLAASWYLMRPTAVDTASKWPDAKSIAVLPFTNMSEDKSAAYFADGVQDDLLTQLSLLGDLKVVSRTSVAEYRDSRKNARQIAAELGVASLVEGSVRREGSRVRVSAQLIDARSDKHVWAASFDRELKDIFAIQSELATEIARALKLSLTPKDYERLTRPPTQNVAAYDLLQQHWTFVQRGVSSAEELQERIALLSRAVKLDPRFALAWARLSSEHARMYFYGFDRSDARRQQAQHAIDRALALSPDDLAVRSELGNYYYYGLRDYARAADYLEGVLQVAPHHVEILVQLAWVRRRQGQWIEATTLLNRALAIDPRNIDALRTLAGNLRIFRHWEEALALQRKIAALRPDDLDEQAELHFLAWSRTGSFDTYDAWRRTLPADAAQRVPVVWYLDLGRAAALRDFSTIVGLLEAPPARGGLAVVFYAKELLALVLLSKGDRARALELAQSLQREALAELKRQPDNLLWLDRSLVTHAMLGEPQAAWADYERWRALLIARPDAIDIERFLGFRTSLYALLGDRDLALQSLRETLKQRRVIVWGHWAHDLVLVSLWDDPRFLQMANDPANNAPIPIANWDLSAMLKSK